MILEHVSVSQLPCLSHKQIAEDCCLTIVGSLVTSGSKLGLALDQNVDSQFWSMKPDGRISWCLGREAFFGRSPVLFQTPYIMTAMEADSSSL